MRTQAIARQRWRCLPPETTRKLARARQGRLRYHVRPFLRSDRKGPRHNNALHFTNSRAKTRLEQTSICCSDERNIVFVGFLSRPLRGGRGPMLYLSDTRVRNGRTSRFFSVAMIAIDMHAIESKRLDVAELGKAQITTFGSLCWPRSFLNIRQVARRRSSKRSPTNQLAHPVEGNTRSQSQRSKRRAGNTLTKFNMDPRNAREARRTCASRLTRADGVTPHLRGLPCASRPPLAATIHVGMPIPLCIPKFCHKF